MKKLSKSTSSGFFLAALLLGTVPAARADGGLYESEEQTPSSTPAASDKSSANFDKTGKFLPGEEVTTSTGQKLKVWSTKGPVEVSRPPEPFEDREKSVLQGGHIVIEEERPRRSPRGGHTRPHHSHQFDPRYKGAPSGRTE